MFNIVASKDSVQPAFKINTRYNISLYRSGSPLAALSSCDIPIVHDRNESAVLWYSRSSSNPPQSPPVLHKYSSNSAYSSSSDSMYLCLMSFH